jgi:hypothetical protein
MSSGTTWSATSRLMVILGVVLAVASLCGMVAGNARAGVPQATVSLAAARAASAPTVTLKGPLSATTGKRLRLTGKVRHARARVETVVIYEKTSKGWVRVASARLTADHHFSAEVRFSQAGAHQLRARYRVVGSNARSKTLVIHVRAADPLLGDSNSFFGSLLGKMVSGLVSGAAGKIGDEAMGAILSLIGWGGSGDQATLDAMNDKLTQIDGKLDAIDRELKSLQSELKITEEEILLNVNDPTAALTEIGTHTDDVVGAFIDARSRNDIPGDDSQKEALVVAEKIQAGDCIENDVNLIYSAICPPSRTAPVLDNFTDLAIAAVADGSDVNDAYLGLENYFTQLIYGQLRGVNLIVESDLALIADGQTVAPLPSTYLNQFRAEKLTWEVRNFMDNVYRLVLSKADLEHTDGFLPSEAESIISRAQFLSSQILGEDNAGLRLHVVVTDDCTKDWQQYRAVSGDGTQLTPESVITSTVRGPTYDWWSGSVVTPSYSYTILAIDFGDAALTDYWMVDLSADRIVATVHMQEYTPDYVVDPRQGTVQYGEGLCHTRTGAIDAFARGAAASASNQPGFENVTFTGSTSAGWVEVAGDEYSAEFEGERQAAYAFTLGGNQKATVTVPVNAHCIGSLSCSSDAYSAGSEADASVRYSVGVWDAAAGAYAVLTSTDEQPTPPANPSTGGQTVNGNMQVDIDNTLDPTFSFTAEPGHKYSVVYVAHASGGALNGYTSASMQVFCGSGLEVKFPAAQK